MTAGWGQPGSQELGASLDTGSFLGPLSLLWYVMLGCDDPGAPRNPRPGGRSSPVLLPRVTPAGIGLPQLGGEHPDDVDEEDEVELWE